MAIFSRRTLQRALRENQAFLSPDQTRAHIRALDGEGQNVLAIEWEVIVLNAFSKVGVVRHEVDLGGSTRPDLVFQPSATPSEGFVADITTVSESGRERANPLGWFRDELVRRARKAGID